jgi:hypothetical protein
MGTIVIVPYPGLTYCRHPYTRLYFLETQVNGPLLRQYIMNTWENNVVNFKIRDRITSLKMFIGQETFYWRSFYFIIIIWCYFEIEKKKRLSFVEYLDFATWSYQTSPLIVVWRYTCYPTCVWSYLLRLCRYVCM